MAIGNRLSAMRARLGGPRRVLDEHAATARSRRYGIIGVFVIVVSLAATAMAYLNPTGHTSYTANMANSAGVRVDDQVRIAGIPVGKVTSVRLDGALVEMKFDVDSSVPVGSDSTLEIKLLTPLGGHYISLDPKGSFPLGRNVIPPTRITLPFEINDIIEAATPVINEVDGDVIKDTFTEVANAANNYPDAVRDLIGSANTLTTSMSESTADFHRSLDFVNDGLQAMVANRAQLATFVEQFDNLGRVYTSRSVDIVELFGLIKELTRILDRIVVFYGREVAPITEGLEDIADTLTAHPERWGMALDGLRQTLEIVVPMLSGNGVVVDESDRRLAPGQDLCLPNIMRHC